MRKKEYLLASKEELLLPFLFFRAFSVFVPFINI